MYQTQSDRYWILGLVSVLTSTSVLTLSASCALAQIKADDSLGSEHSVITETPVNGNSVYQINGGAVRGNNLFHSFDQFSLPQGTTAHFNNATNIQNIISRVTGNSISDIDGTIKANDTANLFLINPHGIVFKSNAALDIKGSFIASTASSFNFNDNIQFSATNPQTVPLLAVGVPIGLQFGTHAAAIHNQSQASFKGATNSLNSPAGLQVASGKTLALVGGDLILEGGNITASQGRIELGSVGNNSLVEIKTNNQNWILGYENVQNFQNIQLTNRGVVDASGEGSGSIHLQGKQVLINRSEILARTLGSLAGGNLTIKASESVELVGFKSGILMTETSGSGKAGDLEITTGKLIVRNVAQVRTGTSGLGSGGKFIINASDSVELSGSLVFGNSVVRTGFISATASVGEAGDIIINTPKLRIADGAIIATESAGKRDRLRPNEFLPAIGKGGNLTVNASESVEIIGTSANGFPTLFSTATRGPGAAGNLTINTGELIVRDGGRITVSSAREPNVIYQGDPTNLGAAGEMNINARFIRLDNKGILLAESEAGSGGDITLNVRNLLLMRRNSQISTNAGKIFGQGDGGNMTINAANGFIVGYPLENSDITANAFAGTGGKITINAKKIFGFVPRSGENLVRVLGTQNPQELNPSRLQTNDITAFSQQNPVLNGQVRINTPDVDPSKSLVELPTDPVDASNQINAVCTQGKNTEKSSFITTGRGGIARSPGDTLMDDAAITEWIKLPLDRENHVGKIKQNRETFPSGDRYMPIIEAQGWVINRDGNVVLVAQTPILTPHTTDVKSPNCGLLGSR